MFWVTFLEDVGVENKGQNPHSSTTATVSALYGPVIGILVLAEDKV